MKVPKVPELSMRNAPYATEVTKGHRSMRENVSSAEGTTNILEH